jgi:N-acetylmuramic acid 6-phosphate etherase
MVDLQPKNAKLRDRSLRILQMVAGITRESSQACLDAAGGDLKVAIVMQLCGVDSGRAAVMLAEQGGRIKEVVRYSGRGRGAVAAS